MTAIRELVFAEVDTRLSAIPGVAEYERMPNRDPARYRAIHTFDPGQRPGDQEAGVTHYDLPLEVVGYIEGDGGAAAHAELSELHASVVAALVTDDMLDGLAESVDEGDLRVFLAPLKAKHRLAFSLDININFSNRRGDPSQPA